MSIIDKLRVRRDKLEKEIEKSTQVIEKHQQLLKDNQRALEETEQQMTKEVLLQHHLTLDELIDFLGSPPEDKEEEPTIEMEEENSDV